MQQTCGNVNLCASQPNSVPLKVDVTMSALVDI